LALATVLKKKTVIGILVVLFLCSLPFILPALNQTPQTSQTQTTYPFSNSQSLPIQAGQPSTPTIGSNPKIEPDLLNTTFLLQEGYLQDGNVRVIVQTQETDKLESQTGLLGGTLTAAFPEMSLAALSVPYSKLDSLAARPYISQVYLDRKIHTCDATSLQLIEPPDEWANVTATYGSLTGAGVKIAIIDTGIDDTHPDFFFPNGTSKIIASSDFTGLNHTWDGYGHGTHCASIAAGTGAANASFVGVAPGASLINAKALDDSGSGYTSWAISAVQWAVGQGADVLSMSFGAAVSRADGSDSMSQAVDWATNQGAVCCVAAGNRGPNYRQIDSPGCAKTALTVGACDKAANFGDFSSSGPTDDFRIKPEVVAPGVDITAAKANNTSMGTTVNQYYTNASGTSAATPHVTGAVALIKQAHPTWTSQQIRSAIVESVNETALKPSWEIFTVDILNGGNGLVDVANAITVTTFASNISASFYVNQTLTPKIFTSTLTFTPSVSSANVTPVKCLTDLPIPLSYVAGNVVFSCPANTSGGWTGRLNVPGGCLFKPSISIPVFALTEYLPPPVASWTTDKVVQTPVNWSNVYAVDGDKLYVADTHYSGLIMEYKLPEMTLLRNVTLPDRPINSIVISDGNLYAGTTFDYVFKISLSSFLIQATAQLPTRPYEGNYVGIVKLLVCNSKLFVATYDGSIYEMDIPTLNLLNSTKLGTENGWATIKTGVVLNLNLYFLAEKGWLYKVDPSNLQAQNLSLGTGGFDINGLVAANGYLYAISNDGADSTLYPEDYLQELLKVTPDLTILNRRAFSTPTSWSLALAYDDNELYVLAHHPPDDVQWYENYAQYNERDYILRIDLTTLESSASLTFTTPANHTFSVALDQPFHIYRENIVAWNDYVICSFDSGKIGLTRDLSPNPSIPTFISYTINSTGAGQPSQISTWWHSKTGLSGFIASTNNSGTWTNQTLQPLSGTFAAANFSFTLNGNAGNLVAWKFYCKDLNNQWSETDIRTFNVTSSPRYTLTILPCDLSSINPVVGQHSYPDQTPVNISLSELTTDAYAFDYWLVDGVKQTGNYTVVVMNQNHTVQAHDRLTSQTVEWERFSPFRPVGYLFICNETEIYDTYSPSYAQTFTVGGTPHSVKTVSLFLSSRGWYVTGPVVVSIRATENGIPYGPDLANGTVSISSLQTSPYSKWISIPMTYPTTPIALNASTQYALVASDYTDTESAHANWGFQAKVKAFSGGELYQMNTTSGKWQTLGIYWSYANTVAMFQIWGATTQNCPNYTITSTAMANGTISPSGEVEVDFNSSQLFTMIPNVHYHVNNVLVDNISIGSVTTYNFVNVTAPHTINASFAIDTFTISASAGSHGTISPSGSIIVNYGDSQSYNITASSHYHIADVLIDGVSVGAVEKYNFTDIQTSHSITASFAIDAYTINATAGANGAISPNGNVSVNYGSNQLFTITANPNYHISDVLVDGSSVGAVSSYTFSNVQAAHTITASFAADSPSTPTPPPSSGGGSTSTQTASPTPSEEPTTTPSPTATSMRPTPTPQQSAPIDYTPVYVGVPVVLVFAVVLAVFLKRR
jgi:hypothetical protein